MGWVQYDLEDYIGNTPLVRLSGNTFGKLEYFNPSGSIKDRTAHYLITMAEREGILKKGMRIVEPSSGNTGISLALLGAIKGYKITIIMPKYVSKERKWMIENYGGKVILVEDEDWREEAIAIAREMSESSPDTVFLNQYESEANIQAHFETTGAELYSQLPMAMDKEINVVIGIGTGGTIVGIAKSLKAKYGMEHVKIIGVQPKSGERIQGLRNVDDDGAGKILTDNMALIDEIHEMSNVEATETTKALWRAGIFVGFSSGAAFNVAKKLSQSEDGIYVVIFPDSGNRYMCR